MKYAFFPGCSLESTAWDFDRSTRAICRALGIELVEIPGWVCCGSTPAHVSDPSLALALPTVNIEKARDMDLDVLTACASCYSRLRHANYKIQNDPAERKRIEAVIGKPCDGSTPVRHILDVLVNDYGLDAIRQHVQKPLSHLRVASYYGCLLTRPRRSSRSTIPNILSAWMTWWLRRVRFRWNGRIRRNAAARDYP